MFQLYQLKFNAHLSLEDAWELLETSAIEIVCASEDENEIFLVVSVESTQIFETMNDLVSYQPYQFPSIDWETQWNTYGHDFHDGCAHIHLSEFLGNAPELLLKPGPGFGDLSHTTTQLALKLLMQTLTQDVVVIDIGCGSGILSLAAALAGAKFVYGIDIDQEAVSHTQQNSLLNHVQNRCFFCLPNEFKWSHENSLILVVMNMIQSEQVIAWNSLPILKEQKGQIITTGIRLEERENYLQQTIEWKWTMQKEVCQDDWCAFIFNF